MPRTTLKPGEIGVTTTYRAHKHNNTWKRATPQNATHWIAETRIGQSTGRPKTIRRIAKTKREAQQSLNSR